MRIELEPAWYILGPCVPHGWLDRRRDHRVSTKDCQVPRDLYLMLWRLQLCLISRGRGVFTVTRRLRVSVGPWWRINNRNNERIIGKICWNNRENDIEIWNRMIGKVLGTIGSALLATKMIKILQCSIAIWFTLVADELPTLPPSYFYAITIYCTGTLGLGAVISVVPQSHKNTLFHTHHEYINWNFLGSTMHWTGHQAFN